jgi:hypothetical protein
MMTSADYVYYVIPKMENGINGGVVKVTFPTKDNSKYLKLKLWYFQFLFTN